MKDTPKKKSVFKYCADKYKFVKQGVWEETGENISKSRRVFYDALKTMVIAVRGFYKDKLPIKASALTYYTLFSAVPVLALIFAIGRGFGFQDLIKNSIINQFYVQSTFLPYLLGFVEKYLKRVQGGIFVGVGVGVLLWSVTSGFRQVESTFNDIWQVKKSRPFLSQFTTYLSLLVLAPVFIIASGGVSVFVVTNLAYYFKTGMSGPLLTYTLKLVPYFINGILFTSLFIIIPNTRVKFRPALIAGIFTGTFFQIFQILYIKGQVYLTTYNTVYGSFAVIPLLLLWLQISWLIILLGAELSFAAQNVSNYEYEYNAQQISRRYKDFLTFLIMHIIVKKFEKGQPPVTAEVISKDNSIPIRLVTNTLNMLADLGVVSELFNQKTKQKAYQPAIDINKISVSYLLDKIEQEGSEGFLRFSNKELNHEQLWSKLDDIRLQIRTAQGSILIKDL